MAETLPDLRPYLYIEALYQRRPARLAFRATSLTEWQLWHARLTATLLDLLGGFDDPVCDLAPRVLERNELDGYVREKVLYWTRPETPVPAWLLLPGDLQPGERRPALICLHGHGRGKDEIVGIAEDGTQRSEPGEYQKDFAIQAVRRGYVVLAPEQYGFGERREPEDIQQSARKSSCRKLSLAALLLGRTVCGIRVWDVMRAVDYLERRPEVDATRIGCLGISGGGTITLFATALDPRIKAALVSGYLNSFHDSIMAISHCEDNYIPGILQYAEMADVACLIAPRPLFVEGGTEDHIFPVEATRAAVAQVRRAYELLGVPERLGCEIFEGKHEFCGRQGFPFLDRWLREQ
jgi:dienelactone hydrolase